MINTNSKELLMIIDTTKFDYEEVGRRLKFLEGETEKRIIDFVLTPSEQSSIVSEVNDLIGGKKSLIKLCFRDLGYDMNLTIQTLSEGNSDQHYKVYGEFLKYHNSINSEKTNILMGDQQVFKREYLCYSIDSRKIKFILNDDKDFERLFNK